MTKLERQTRYLLLVEKFEGSDTATIAWQCRGSDGISPSQSARRLTDLRNAGFVNWAPKKGWTLTDKGRKALRYVIREKAITDGERTH